MEYLIPHYGDFSLLKRAVESVINTDPAAQVIVGDDTKALTNKQFANRHVRVITGPGEGFAANVNNLVAQTRGEWITILNNDVELDINWWKEMSAIISSLGVHDFSVASSLLRSDGTIDSLGDAMSWYGVGYNRYHLYRPHPRYFVTTSILGATGGLMVVRRRLFLQLGGFSSVLQSYCEDTQLNMRATAKGYRSWYYPQPRALHRGTSTFALEKKYFQSAKNSIIYIRTDYAGSFRAIMLRRVTAYWRVKALLSRRFRADILAGIRAGYTTVIKPYKNGMYYWPKGSYRENYITTHLRLIRQVLASVRRRWYT